MGMRARVVAWALAGLFGWIAAAQSQVQWTPEFGFGTLSASATAGCAWDDDGDGTLSLFVAGTFTTAGGVACNHIAEWDGQQWHPLGAGLASTGTFSVNVLQVCDDGSGPALYAGGVFNLCGGLPCKCVARWRNNAWEAVGAGLGEVSTNTGVKSFTAFNGSLYAGGTFSVPGPPVLSGVARWTGAAWAVVNNALGSHVECLLPYNDQLGGGEKLYAGGSSIGLHRLDGATWTDLNVSGGSSSRVTRLALFNPTWPAGKDQLVAAGQFTMAGGVAHENIAAWDGAAWNDLGGVAVTADFPSISAIGVFHVGAPTQAEPVLWLGGTIAQGGGVPGNYIMTYRGGAWSAVTNPQTYPYFMVEWKDGHDQEAKETVVAGGITSSGLGKLHNNAWVPLGSGCFGFSPAVNDLEVMATPEDLSKDALIVAGAITVYPQEAAQSASGLARVTIGFEETFFDGKISAGMRLPLSSTLGAVCAIPDGFGDLNNLLAAGFFTTPCGGKTLVRAAKDGAATCAGQTFGNADVRKAKRRRRDNQESPVVDVVVAGNFLDAGAIPGNSYVGLFDLSTNGWITPLPIPRPNGPVFSVAVGDLNHDGFDDTFCGGSFAQITGQCGTVGTDNWCMDLSGTGCVYGTGAAGFAGSPLCCVIDGEENRGAGAPFGLYVGGTFVNAGSTVLNYIAVWDGANWQPLGSGLNGVVRALAMWDAHDGNGKCLYAAGDFTTAGGNPAIRIARWDGQQWSAPVSPADSGLNATVNALQVWDAGDGRGPSLAVGGKFTLAGGLSAGRIARLIGGPNPCPADVNWSGQVDLSDFFDWFNWWDITDIRADVNGDLQVDLNDFFEFFNHFDVSC